MSKFIAEVCCGTVEDALVSDRVGADRIELCSVLEVGGLTPTPGLVQDVLDQTNLQVVAMLRPRAGGFTYNANEVAWMHKDLDWLLQTEIDGVALGLLTAENEIDFAQLKPLTDRIKAAGKEVVIHRAFDNALSDDAWKKLGLEAGVDRILTAGGTAKAVDGLARLHEIHEGMQADEKTQSMQLLAGGSVTHENVEKIYRETGITQFHSSCRGWAKDNASGHVDYSATPSRPNERQIVDEDMAQKYVAAIRALEKI